MKQFLKENNFILIWNEIDYWYGDFEFAFINSTTETSSGQSRFSSTNEVREYFENRNFEVDAVMYRNWKYDSYSLQPRIKSKKLFRKFFNDGKDFYVVRISTYSKYFEKSNPEDECQFEDLPIKTILF